MRFCKLLFVLLVNQCFSADILIEWKPVKNAKHYDVTYVSDSGFSLTQTVDSEKYIIKNAEAGRKYIVTIQARDNSTNKSETSIPLFIEIPKTNNNVKLKQPEPKFQIK